MDGVLIVIAILAVGAWQTRGHVRGAAPNFALQVLDGSTATLASFAGKPTLLAFWAPWCGVCRANEGSVEQLKEWAGDRAHVVSVASDYRDPEEIRAYAAEHHLGDPVLLGGKATARAYGVQAFPTYYFLDEAGRITGSSVGYTTSVGMAARLFALP